MTQKDWDEKLTKEQRQAMRDLAADSGYTLESLIEQSLPPAGIFPYVAIPNFHGMYVGIEPDGYTHS